MTIVDLIVLGVCAAWAICGVLAWGLTIEFYEQKWPYFAYISRNKTTNLAAAGCIAGPIGLAVALLMCRIEHHKPRLQFRRLSREESYQAYVTEWPSLKDKADREFGMIEEQEQRGLNIL